MVLTQIETCLNYRPLFAISSDVNDPQPLTPGHFLIGSALTAFPDTDLVSTPSNQLRRWQLLQKFVQSHWRRWCKDYLHQFQQRNKWQLPSRNIPEGDVVVIFEDILRCIGN